MKIEIKHSVVQDESVLKFFKLKDYFRCIEFLDNSSLKWKPLKYSSTNDTASIRVNESVLKIVTNKFCINKTITN